MDFFRMRRLLIMTKCNLSSSICTSPIGSLMLRYCSEGLHEIGQISSINDQTFVPNPKELIELQSSTGDDPLPDDALEWLEDFFNPRPSKTLVLPSLCPHVITDNRSFQEHVWHTLLHRVPFGKTITYAQLAELAGNKRAARAVGSAMRRNPFQLLVPCHRVIHSDGKPGNYSGGERNRVKSWLLKFEETYSKNSSLQ